MKIIFEFPQDDGSKIDGLVLSNDSMIDNKEILLEHVSSIVGLYNAEDLLKAVELLANRRIP